MVFKSSDHTPSNVTPEELEVLRAAVLWWFAHRPPGWTYDMLLRSVSPTLVEKAEIALAKAVQALVTKPR